MKRSAQVALVLMGVTGTTAAGAYMMPARGECAPAKQAPVRDITDLGKHAQQTEPCRRRSSGSSSGRWGSWHWGSSYSNYRGTQTTSGRPPNSTSVGFSSSNTAARSGSSTGSSSSSSSSSSASRGGFGSTGHSMSGGHSSGS